ncbi:MAG: glycosyltransferase [Candidatus Thermoplasmatota archaeon]|nr:glycosyltransferase [Candidatus Thermoplasmatota archaeon]MDH7506254.1 glycosyltransferase [Candidatus Thermoplasmatota archaeon]
MGLNELPVVLVGCPVQNREFIIKEYLNCIYNLDYPKEKIIVGFFVNNSIDKTNEIIQEWQQKHKEEYNQMLYFEDKKVYKGKMDSQKRDRRDFTLFAVVRNLFIKKILPYPFDYLFSYDSDILIPPHTLKQLLSHNKDICSILVWNGKTQFNTDNYNYRKWLSVYDKKANIEKWNYYSYRVQPTKLFEVDITGACYLLKRQVLDTGIKYKSHKYGEDWEFCLSAKERGFKLFCDPTINNFHAARWDK